MTEYQTCFERRKIRLVGAERGLRVFERLPARLMKFLEGGLLRIIQIEVFRQAVRQFGVMRRSAPFGAKAFEGRARLCLTCGRGKGCSCKDQGRNVQFPHFMLPYRAKYWRLSSDTYLLDRRPLAPLKQGPCL